jgi:phosphopantothenoylcysteine decarboxylase/phosphopantothenate--cysteine ligase
MGVAVAREAYRRGAQVTVVHGPLGVAGDFPATWISVTSAREMHEKVLQHLPAEIFVGTAAVADYRPTETSATKIKRSGKVLTLNLDENPDIALTVAERRRRGDLVIGFAAETKELIPHAKLKLEAKGLDLIVANEVEREHRGFTVDRVNAVMLDRRGETTSLADTDKTEVARILLDRAEKELRERA